VQNYEKNAKLVTGFAFFYPIFMIVHGSRGLILAGRAAVVTT
jgi:hypothetical protein